MDETFCTKVVFLGRKSFREKDEQAIVYSLDFGKMNLVVRGAKKITSKLVAHVEPINLSDVMIIRGKLYNYIGAVKNNDCFFNIKNDLTKLEVAGEVIKIFNELVSENQKDEALYFLLKDFLNCLDNLEETKFCNSLGIAFQSKLLKLLGYRPEIANCVICKKPINDNFYFNYSRGGLICKECSEINYLGLTVSSESINILKLMLDSDFNKIVSSNISNERSLQEIKTILRKLYEYQI